MAPNSESLYLGLDLSTQQLKAIVVTSSLNTVAQAKVDFDADFSHKYATHKGVHVNPSTEEVYAPVAMWLESLDLVLQRLSGLVEISEIRGIGGSCQQHGSVFWKAEGLLRQMMRVGKGGDDRLLVDRLEGALASEWSPNWQDQSTQEESEEFDGVLGGREELARVTGSGAHHRFTGLQIMRLRRIKPDVYAQTSRISLVSSWLASVLIGRIAPLDISDVCGMNLWDIPNQCYSEKLLALAAGGGTDGADGLRTKLGEPRMDGGGSLGQVSGYFVKRYGFREDCQVVPFTGDNPATILALPLRKGDVMVSLGTSTTFLMNTDVYKPDGAYHFFNHPTTPGSFMFMLCYKNGGLAREKVRDELLGENGRQQQQQQQQGWNLFNEKILETRPLDMIGDDDRAKLGLYFPLRETVPNIRAGTYRFTCDRDGSNLRREDDSSSSSNSSWDVNKDARIIVESQALSMRLRSRNLVAVGNDETKTQQPRRIYLVGGGSANPAIARVMGEVLGGSEGVWKLDVGGNACALGGAFKAVWALERRDEGERFEELIRERWREEVRIAKVDDGYREGVWERYGEVLRGFEEMERRLLEEEGKKK